MNSMIKFSDEGNNLKNNLGYNDEDINKLQKKCQLSNFLLK